jgi:hypothetical protein
MVHLGRRSPIDEPITAAAEPLGTPLTPRERWLRTLRFQSVDHVPDEEFGYWTETLQVWRGQGVP